MRPDLTDRQRYLARLVSEGHTNEQIAAGMGLKPGSVRNTLSRIYRRLGLLSVNPRVLLARWYWERAS